MEVEIKVGVEVDAWAGSRWIEGVSREKKSSFTIEAGDEEEGKRRVFFWLVCDRVKEGSLICNAVGVGVGLGLGLGCVGAGKSSLREVGLVLVACFGRASSSLEAAWWLTTNVFFFELACVPAA